MSYEQANALLRGIATVVTATFRQGNSQRVMRVISCWKAFVECVGGDLSADDSKNVCFLTRRRGDCRRPLQRASAGVPLCFVEEGETRLGRQRRGSFAHPYKSLSEMGGGEKKRRGK